MSMDILKINAEENAMFCKEFEELLKKDIANNIIHVQKQWKVNKIVFSNSIGYSSYSNMRSLSNHNFMPPLSKFYLLSNNYKVSLFDLIKLSNETQNKMGKLPMQQEMENVITPNITSISDEKIINLFSAIESVDKYNCWDKDNSELLEIEDTGNSLYDFSLYLTPEEMISKSKSIEKEIRQILLEYISKKIKRLRIDYDIMQKDLAKCIGCKSKNSIHLIETQTNLPTLTQLYMLAYTFNINVMEFLPSIKKVQEILNNK